jgi:tRNA dimethylallyltransferase
MNQNRFNLITILGPTATGKTRIGVQVAKVLSGEIISADSRQVYRGMDIGTGKDLEEYGTVPYHLVDIVEPGREFSVFDFQRLFNEAFKNILARRKMPILVGGSGLYLDSILRGYQFQEVPENGELRRELSTHSLSDLAERLKKIKPGLHNTTDLTDRHRLIRAVEIAEFSIAPKPRDEAAPILAPLVFGVRWDRDILQGRITDRLRARLNQGMIEEVKKLHQAGVSFDQLDSYGLEYRYVARYLKGELNRNDLFQKLGSAIRQFAKRQETWFRRMERNGVGIHWMDGDKEPAAAILRMLRERDEKS